MDDFDLGDNPAISEIKALTKKIAELEAENAKIKQVIVDNELEEELEGLDCTSLEERICMDGIRYIGDRVEAQDFDQNDVKNFDTLYKTLRTIRGQALNPSKKGKKLEVADLLKIVKSDKA